MEEWSLLKEKKRQSKTHEKLSSSSRQDSLAIFGMVCVTELVNHVSHRFISHFSVLLLLDSLEYTTGSERMIVSLPLMGQDRPSVKTCFAISDTT